MRRWWQPILAVPTLMVTLPLTGFAFQNEERRMFVRAAREFGSDPLAVAYFVFDTLGLFLKAGNFRPLGRFLEQAERAFAVETAEATGLALHVVQGLVRLTLAAALALTAARMMVVVMRSAGVTFSLRPLLALYSLTLGMTMVASHHLSNMTAFPVAYLGSPLFVLVISLAVAGDGGMRHRRLTRREYVAMATLGAAAAMFYDLVYTVPILAAAFVLVYGVECRTSARLGGRASVGGTRCRIPRRVHTDAGCHSCDVCPAALLRLF